MQITGVLFRRPFRRNVTRLILLIRLLLNLWFGEQFVERRLLGFFEIFLSGLNLSFAQLFQNFLNFILGFLFQIGLFLVCCEHFLGSLPGCEGRETVLAGFVLLRVSADFDRLYFVL